MRRCGSDALPDADLAPAVLRRHETSAAMATTGHMPRHGSRKLRKAHVRVPRRQATVWRLRVETNGTSRKHRHLSHQLVFQVHCSVLMQAGWPRTLIMIQPRPDASLNELTPHSRMQRAGIRPGLGVATQWVSSGRVTQRSAQKREDRKQRGGGAHSSPEGCCRAQTEAWLAGE